MRGAGITERQRGGGDYFSEPVLIWRRLGGRRDVYDQNGRLVAIGTAPAGWSQFFGIYSTTTYVTPDDQTLVTVSPENRNRFTVTGRGIAGSGSVASDLFGDIHLELGGQQVAYLDRPWLPMLRFRRPDFTICDTDDDQIGSGKQRKRFARWTVIEVDPDVTEPLRSLLFGVEAVLDSLRRPRGGG